MERKQFLVNICLCTLLVANIFLFNICLQDALTLRAYLRDHGAWQESASEASGAHGGGGDYSPSSPGPDIVDDGLDTVMGYPQMPSKWYASQEALDEIGHLQGYMAAIAHHDAHAVAPVYVVALFDLAARLDRERAVGWGDFRNAMDPSNPIWTSTLQWSMTCPLTWGHLLATDIRPLPRQCPASSSSSSAQQA